MRAGGGPVARAALFALVKFGFAPDQITVCGDLDAELGRYPEAQDFIRCSTVQETAGIEFSVVFAPSDDPDEHNLQSWPLSAVPVVADLSRQHAKYGLLAQAEASGCVVLCRSQVAMATGWEQFRRCCYIITKSY